MIRRHSCAPTSTPTSPTHSDDGESSARVYRLAYHALTRQYRLGTDGLTQTFETLDDAVRAMRSVRGWRAFEAARVAPGTEYEARVRLRLDASQLPKPFQVNAITSREWSLASDWHEIQLPADLLR